MTKFCAVLLVMCGSSAAAFADAKLSGQVTDLNDQPVRGARVVVTGSQGLETLVKTDPTGHYTATVHAAGSYSVVFSFGETQMARRIDVPAEGTMNLNATLELGGEVIEIHEKLRPLQLAQPKQDPLRIPPYSDKAILEDRWSKAWLLLDVDDRGVVDRIKFLKRPGNDLDAIAVKFAFELQFDPARNNRGVPTRTYIVWPLEWPSHQWLIGRYGIITRMPKYLADADEVLPIGMEGPRWPRCAGTGPMQLNASRPTLRDCSEPDLSRADASEPWIVRDASVPPPPAKVAPTLDPVMFRAQQVATRQRFRTSAIIASAVTGALVVGGAVAYTQWRKYDDRADAATDSVHRSSYQKSATGWEVGMTAFLASAVGTGMISSYLWSRASRSLVLQRNADGSYVGYAGSF
jgi:hypothetical protein